MKKYFVSVLVMTCLICLSSKHTMAEALIPSTYELGNGYALKFGNKAVGLRHGRHIVALKKSNVALEGDALTFTLTRPENDFGGDGRSLGIVYTNTLKENVTSSLSLTGGPGDLGAKDIAMTFRLHIKLR